MAELHRESSAGRSTLLALIGLLIAVGAWGLPARWWWTHPSVLSAAGRGTPSLVQVGDAATQAGRPGPGFLLATAAIRLGMTGTNELMARLEAAVQAPAARVLGGADPVLGRVAGLRLPLITNGFGTAMEVFLPEGNRGAMRTFLSSSQLPSTRAILAARDFGAREFIPVQRPGGQPLEAVILMLATLAESDVLNSGWASELQGMLGHIAPGAPNEAFEHICLDVLTLSRRLDWTSFRELVRTVPSSAALHRWTATVRTNQADLPLLYSAAVLSGSPGKVAAWYSQPGPSGRLGLETALRGGVGATRAYAEMSQPVGTDGFTFRGLAAWVGSAPEVARVLRSAMLGIAALLLASAVGGALEVGGMGDATSSWAGTLALGLALGFFLFILAEPTPPRPPKPPGVRVHLLSSPTAAAGGAVSRERPVMEPKTVATIVLFALLQLTVYVICRRKITEIREMEEPAAVRLRLMENEENLFDAGLYIGIAGTAAALVLQVLHVVEANLLAAYSSNLLGIVTVALVKIRHVRPIKRELILEGQAEAGSGPVR